MFGTANHSAAKLTSTIKLKAAFQKANLYYLRVYLHIRAAAHIHTKPICTTCVYPCTYVRPRARARAHTHTIFHQIICKQKYLQSKQNFSIPSSAKIIAKEAPRLETSPACHYVLTFGEPMTLAGFFMRLAFAFPVACPVEFLVFAVSVSTADFFICQQINI